MLFYTLSDDEVVKREFGAYDNVNDNYPMLESN